MLYANMLNLSNISMANAHKLLHRSTNSVIIFVLNLRLYKTFFLTNFVIIPVIKVDLSRNNI